MFKSLSKHLPFYIIEILILGGGFALLLNIDINIQGQVVILSGMLMIYIMLGLIHHKINNDIKGRIVLEYILMSGLILALFLFLNITRI